jgi:hypothetical protein
MIATLASFITIVLAILLFRWFASVPLVRTLSTSIDQWADSVQGTEPEPAADGASLLSTP